MYHKGKYGTMHLKKKFLSVWWKCVKASTSTLQTIEPGLSFRFQNLTACGEKNIGPLAKHWYHTHLQMMQVQRLFFHTATKFATRWTKPIITRGIKFIRKIEHRGKDCYGIYLKPSILKGNVKKFQNCMRFSLDSRFSIFAYRFHL